MKGSKSEPESNTLSASKGSPSPPSSRQSKQARSKIEVFEWKDEEPLGQSAMGRDGTGKNGRGSKS